ncbi:hypothetical protein OCK74_01640 [Chitinophagaceae bacterium LB-8]|uniref:DUF3828 domain-containing protein n=1 Tax=Paraflavisolibacter caeni TaxID=2982496 RepID=A0A9X3BGH7_9BACT|nr:hypothetical protein [Paraflavisolibacter caeni]MCU7547792.1 hypothetical protein [Paraflavisolibacter caeni]
MRLLLILFFSLAVFASCADSLSKEAEPSSSPLPEKPVDKDYKCITYIDSFINVNREAINKNKALREHYEGLVTQKLLPLIDKKGLYDSIPFKLVATTLHNGVAYGNFIFDDDVHYIKVQCIIKKEQLDNLKEDSQYLIKFKTIRFEDGVSFDNSFSEIELPTVNAYLKSFTPY